MRHLLADNITRELKERITRELKGNLLPFWVNHIQDKKNGGFIGRMSSDGIVDENAPKGLVLNARILWTFSALCGLDHHPDYMRIAGTAYDYLVKWFQDNRYQGYCWMLDSRGNVLDDGKKLYGQAFVIYACSEYYRATGQRKALETACSLFHVIDKMGHDSQYSGYYENFKRDWTPANGLRLSAVDMAEKKSMNTHLHLLEAFTHLYRIWPDRLLQSRLRETLDIFLTRILHPHYKHFLLFFDEKWTSKSKQFSYGHDIEGSWLMNEAAHVLNDRKLIRKVETESIAIVDRLLEEVLVPDRGLPNEGDPEGITDADRHWWPQAEAVVGLFNAYQISGNERYLKASLQVWEYIDNNIVDRQHGEWHWKVSEDGIPDPRRPKVSEWKCPYHNVRACLEILRRIPEKQSK